MNIEKELLKTAEKERSKKIRNKYFYFITFNNQIEHFDLNSNEEKTVTSLDKNYLKEFIKKYNLKTIINKSLIDRNNIEYCFLLKRVNGIISVKV